MDICVAKIDRIHNNSDIEYLESWIAHVNVTKNNEKKEEFKIN
jgi:hypothetical protein